MRTSRKPIRILSLQELKYRYYRIKNCYGLLKMFLAICRLIYQARRRTDDVRTVLQAILDHPHSLVPVPSDLYYGTRPLGLPKPEKMMCRQSELYRSCLLDLRLWKPTVDKGGATCGCGWYYNTKTHDRVCAGRWNQEPLVYKDPRITELLTGYGLSTVWPDEQAFANSGSPFQVVFDVPTSEMAAANV